ncbi:nuclease [Vibrio panuliri]|uniref:phosphodiesterase I n=1 Tax=Vibrio panuliri TaxID=1381081 RepID=A0A1Q9HN10_9VIBR|nr:VRR-NUC domain-containing protein [Vibrio panuliri]OLQ92108.1 nuclease [Vibrio panuliri]
MKPEIQLAEDYYLDNFSRLIEHALKWYQDFLSHVELNWIARFRQLDKQSQCLLVRLYSRKGHYFRSDKLSYAEIPLIPAALSQLAANDFITLNSPITEQQLAQSLLTKTELSTLFPEIAKSLNKPQMVALLKDVPFVHFDQLQFDVIDLCYADIIDFLLTLFFANTHQDLTQFVLSDLGLNTFEDYQLSKERRFFSHRSQVEQLIALGKLSEQYWACDRKQLESLKDLSAALPQPIDHDYVERKRQHLINDIARDFERLEDYQTALSLYAQTSLPPSRERQARIFDKLNDDKRFSDNVTLILTQPYNLSELEIGQKLQQRLQRKQGQKVSRSTKPPHNQHHLTLDLTQQRVELAVKDHYETLGWQVYFSENTLLNGLLGLALWEAVFAPVEGAFINAYQFKPLDLYHAEFYAKRHKLIELRLKDIANGNCQFIIDNHKVKFGISNPFVNWTHLPEPLLKQALKSIPSSMLEALLRVQLSDLKLYRNGLPDLIAFKDGEFQWIEVKGPGDKLQDNQLRWIKQFNRLGVPFSVCYVESLINPSDT